MGHKIQFVCTRFKKKKTKRQNIKNEIYLNRVHDQVHSDDIKSCELWVHEKGDYKYLKVLINRNAGCLHYWELVNSNTTLYDDC